MSDREQVTIKWGTVRGPHGWEAFTSQGRQTPGWHPLMGRLDKQDAIALAQETLAERVAQYGGDWRLLVVYQEWEVKGSGDNARLELVRDSDPVVMLTE